MMTKWRNRLGIFLFSLLLLNCNSKLTGKSIIINSIEFQNINIDKNLLAVKSSRQKTVWGKDTIRPIVLKKNSVKEKSPIIIRGIVVDNSTNKAFYDVEVQLKGTEFRAKTDIKGAFTLEIPDSLQYHSYKLFVYKTDYEIYARELFLNDNQYELSIRLEKERLSRIGSPPTPTLGSRIKSLFRKKKARKHEE